MTDNQQIVGDAGGGRQDSLDVDMKPNSHKYNQPKKIYTKSPVDELPAQTDRPKVKKVVTGEARIKSPSFGAKLKSTFTGDDARSVGTFILFDVVVPAVKSMLADAASQGTERLLFGDQSSRPRTRGSGNGQHIPYSRMSMGSSNSSRRNSPREFDDRDRATHNFDSIIVESRPEAEEILDRLTISIEEYGSARVTDFYEMVGITGSFTDDKWGWLSLRDSGIKHVRGGYLIVLPLPVHIE